MSKSYMNLEVAYQHAVEKLGQKNPVDVARNAAVDFDPEQGAFTVPFLGAHYGLSYPEGKVTLAGEGQKPSLTVQILLLHYLINANGAPLQNKLISFKELPNGVIYNEPFGRRAIQPMLKLFADKQDVFVREIESLGGRRQNLGDTSAVLSALPKVPVTFVIWSADEEFPASGNILFDASAPCYLPTEDYAILSGLVIQHLGGMLPKEG